MSRRSLEARALESPLFRQKIVDDVPSEPTVCSTCSGFGEVKHSKHDEGEMCPVCGGLGFELK